MRRGARLLAAVFALLVVPGLLLAHGVLKLSEPAANAVLSVAPRVIRLTFTEPAELAISRIELTGPDGEMIALSPVRRGDSASVMVSDIAAPLRAGRYTVTWQVAGRDGHPVRGMYQFVITAGAAGTQRDSSSSVAASKAGPGLAPAPGAAAPSADGAPEVDAFDAFDAFDAESRIFAAIRWLGFIGLLALIGTVGFIHLMLPGAARRQAPASWMVDAGQQARRAGVAGAVVLLIALLLRFAAQAVAVHGRMIPGDTTLLTDTLWGKAWLVQLVAVSVALAMLLKARHSVLAGWLLPLAITAMAAASALSGHAAAVAGNMVLPVMLDAAHILAAGGWMGTLLLVVLAGLPAAMRTEPGKRGSTVALVINTFSPLALIFAGTVVLTGVASAWIQLPRLDALWTTRYGQVLLWKLGTVLLVAAAGAYNSYRVRPTLGAETGGARIGRSATAELLLAAVVLAITAVLVATPTAGEAL